MKKTFVVEIEYNEKPENVLQSAPVLYDMALEVAVENFMQGYKETNSIEPDFSVHVKQL